jgi:ABC-type transport system involved in multi-copper enzyme maturation permease subunit
MVIGVVGRPAGSYSIRVLASLGEDFYYAIATVQLAAVLLVAPAATAGAICVDRARGTLTHMMLTDLHDVEIVLGKLAARLLPVFALVATTVPVLALAGLLGGIIIEAIVTLTLITIALAVLGCALALALSVRATKVHEVLMAVYGIEVIWIFGPLVWTILEEMGVPYGPPDWWIESNPFFLAWAPYTSPGVVGMAVYFWVLGAAILVSAALIAYAVLRLRSAATMGSGSRARRAASWISRARQWVEVRRPGPSLDDDPVLWCEWRRTRPSRLARIIWGCYFVLASAATALSILMACSGSVDIAALLTGFQATIGLLLVSISAPTALAEERARGSLEVLMTTPLSTDRIVLSKWWGAYRSVPAIAFLPALGALVIGFAAPEVPPQFTRMGQAHDPLGWIDRVAFVCLPTAILLAQGAVVTSFGLALATWMRRVGRAIALSVASYVAIAFGWLVSVELLPSAVSWLGLFGPDDQDSAEFYAMIAAGLCPAGAQLIPFLSMLLDASVMRCAFYIGHVIVFLTTIGIALFLLGLTLAMFNRSMGRMPVGRRRAPNRPRTARAARAPHLGELAFRKPVLSQAKT